MNSYWRAHKLLRINKDEMKSKATMKHSRAKASPNIDVLKQKDSNSYLHNDQMRTLSAHKIDRRPLLDSNEP